MADLRTPGGRPRRSFSGPQTSSSATPRRAFDEAEQPPILSGYEYQPGHSAPTAITAEPWQPITAGVETPDSINNYRSRPPVLWLAIIGLVLALAVVGAIVISNMQSTPDASQTSPRPSTYATQTRSGGTAFEDSAVSGYWKITNCAWGTSGVTLTIEITVDTGTLYYDFYGYANSDRTQLPPVTSGATELEPGFIGPGQTVTGTLAFELDRQPMTVVLISRGMQQLSALAVPS
ncbi:MAG: hypothetical protein LBV06_05765 [Propionibacteriaceae bacterium]|jgi:hypothetical protein|nr:hypothetical protein [Propionibacteriaceae bacterium]